MWGLGVLLLMLASALFLASCGGANDEEPASGSGEETVPEGEEAESAGQASGSASPT